MTGFAKYRLGELASFVSGGTPSKKVPEFWGGDTPWISAKDLKALRIDSSIDTLSEKGRALASLVPPGSILILVRGMSLFKSIPIGIAMREMAINQDLKGLVPTDKVSSLFLAYCLLAHEDALLQLVDAAGHGTGRLDTDALKDFVIRIPSRDEQDRITDLLTNWDTAIETTERLIAAKEQQHHWLLQRLINRRTARLHWETQELGDLLFERNERSSQHDEFPVLTSSRRGLFLQSEYFSKQVTSEDNTGYKIMRRGDFTFRSMSDDGRFVFNRLEQYDAGIISPAYGVFYADGVSPEFLAHYLNSNYFAQLLARETQGGTRKALRFSALASMEVELPQRADQERIAAILDESRREIDLLQTQLEMLRRQKRGLMQKLLTGKWRVPLPSAESSFQETAPC